MSRSTTWSDYEARLPQEKKKNLNITYHYIFTTITPPLLRPTLHFIKNVIIQTVKTLPILQQI